MARFPWRARAAWEICGERCRDRHEATISPSSYMYLGVERHTGHQAVTKNTCYGVLLLRAAGQAQYTIGKGVMEKHPPARPSHGC